MNRPPDDKDPPGFLLDDSTLVRTDFDHVYPNSENKAAVEQIVEHQGPSLMITSGQRRQLQALGLEESIIRVMKPEEAHKILGLKQ